MATRTEQSRNGGIGFLGALAILFIALKLLNITVVASWSWWLVLAPIWGPLALVLAIGVVWLLIGLLIEGVKAVKSRKRTRK